MCKCMTLVYISFYLYAWGDTYLEKSDMDVRRTRPPFSRPSAAPQDPLFSIFHFHKTPLLKKKKKITKFRILNFPLKVPKFCNFLRWTSLPKPKLSTNRVPGYAHWSSAQCPVGRAYITLCVPSKHGACSKFLELGPILPNLTKLEIICFSWKLVKDP